MRVSATVGAVNGANEGGVSGRTNNSDPASAYSALKPAMYAANRPCAAAIDALLQRCTFLILKSIVAVCLMPNVPDLRMAAGSEPPAHADHSDCGCPNVTRMAIKKHY